MQSHQIMPFFNVYENKLLTLQFEIFIDTGCTCRTMRLFKRNSNPAVPTSHACALVAKQAGSIERRNKY